MWGDLLHVQGEDKLWDAYCQQWLRTCFFYLLSLNILMQQISDRGRIWHHNHKGLWLQSQYNNVDFMLPTLSEFHLKFTTVTSPGSNLLIAGFCLFMAKSAKLWHRGARIRLCLWMYHIDGAVLWVGVWKAHGFASCCFSPQIEDLKALKALKSVV